MTTALHSAKTAPKLARPVNMPDLHHLLRRAGFGARPQELSHYCDLGISGTTDELLHPERINDPIDQVQSTVGEDLIDYNSIYSLQNWWLLRMARTQRPLEEKMTLYWHNHFATANYKVDNVRWMWQQNQLFRTHCLGNFRQILGDIARDPAMLMWLDGAENRKGQPNENFARELMELFALGIGGGYTESDVKEGARAFTGWYYDQDAEAFVFNPDRHDDGVKSYLGQTGRLNGDDVLDIVAAHPSTGPFVATKLFKFFVCDTPTKADIDQLATIYYQSGYEIRPMVAHLLTSDRFYSDAARYAKIKSPAELMVTAVRTLDAPMDVFNNAPNQMVGAGQDLFNPPNVKGWPEGQSWINTTTLLARINFATDLTQTLHSRNLLIGNLRRAMLDPNATLTTPMEVVDNIWTLLLPGLMQNTANRNALIAYVSDGQYPGSSILNAHVSGLVGLIMSTPEYQLA